MQSTATPIIQWPLSPASTGSTVGVEPSTSGFSPSDLSTWITTDLNDPLTQSVKGIANQPLPVLSYPQTPSTFNQQHINAYFESLLGQQGLSQQQQQQGNRIMSASFNENLLQSSTLTGSHESADNNALSNACQHQSVLFLRKQLEQSQRLAQV